MKRLYLIISTFCIISIWLFNYTCDQQLEPVPSFNETPYGTVTQVDAYPLYKIDYSSDYKFEQFLNTGEIPFITSIKSIPNNYCCTCFSAFGNNQRLLGRNYDWLNASSYFLVITNPSNGYSSISTVDMYFFEYDQGKSPGSEENLNTIRTLPYYPFDGINEKGVAIGMNSIDSADPPYDPAKITIGELQLIRLVLDYAASTREAVALIQHYNIRMDDPPLHFLIADSTGHSVIVEFINGSMETIDNSNPWQVTTNFIVAGLDHYENAPCNRYKNACEKLDVTNGCLLDADAMELLKIVSVSYTQWSAVFNLKTVKMQIVMGRKYDNPHNFILP